MKQCILVLLLTASFAVVSAQIVSEENVESTGAYVPNIDPEIEFDAESQFEDIYLSAPQVRTLDNIVWHKSIWRMIDMREQINYALYYPLKESNGGKNLFLTIFDLLKEGKVHAYAYDETKEDFSEEFKLSFEEVMELANVEIYETSTAADGSKSYEINEVDIPNESVLKYYIKEVWYFDDLESCMKFKIECIAPQIYYVTEDGLEEKRVMFWVPFDELRPWIAKQAVVVNNKNAKAFMSYDDLFQTRRFVGHIYKEYNVQNRSLIEYCSTPEEVRFQQSRIENEIMNFEQDLWEY